MRISDWSSDVCSSDLCGIEGPKSNIAFLERLVRHPVVVEAGIDTGYLDRNPEDFIGAGDDAGPIAAAATVALLQEEAATRAATARSGAARKTAVSGKTESARVDLGGRSILTKQNQRRPKQH